LVTGIVILPQRQTALVAKQAAQVDVLSGGRLRLGIGIGWNEVEYEALGENFHNRGRRSEEQVDVLRTLWTQDVVTFEGRWHHINAAGINPLPVQRPIPLWFGGGRSEPVLRRIARMGDGWFPQMRPDDAGAAELEKFRTFAREAGRDPATLGVEGRAGARDGIEAAVQTAEAWRELGATHFALNTMSSGFTTVEQHIGALREFAEAAGV
jgi:probable F420-dependent oxidoreductase